MEKGPLCSVGAGFGFVFQCDNLESNKKKKKVGLWGGREWCAAQIWALLFVFFLMVLMVTEQRRGVPLPLSNNYVYFVYYSYASLQPYLRYASHVLVFHYITHVHLSLSLFFHSTNFFFCVIINKHPSCFFFV